MIVHSGRHTYAPGIRQPMHSHPGYQVSLVLRGTLRERTSRGEEVAGPLSMVVKLPGVGHADEYGNGGTEMLQLMFECSSLDLFEADDDSAGMPPWKWIHGGPLARVILRLHPRNGMRDVVPDDDPAVADLIAGITPVAQPRGAPPVWLRRVREQLGAELSRKPSVEMLAKSAGVHPVHLARCFRRWYSRSISGFLEDARLKRAAGMLAHSTASISHVAYTVGFADEAHFCRRFHRELGFTPGSYRRLLSPPATRSARSDV